MHFMQISLAKHQLNWFNRQIIVCVLNPNPFATFLYKNYTKPWQAPQGTFVMKKIIATALLSLAVVSTSAHAAIEIDENQDFGPTYGSTVADATIGKPLQLANAVLGTALHVVTLPFNAYSGSVDESYETLVRKPWEALRRCTGCTPEYDHSIKNEPQTQYRFVVTQPSEIIINSNDNVVIQ